MWRCELRTETSQRDNKGGLLRNKGGLLENKRGLLADRGRFADIADMLTLISKSNTKKIKKGILAIYPFLINLWKLMSACQQCQRLEDFRMAHLVDFRLQMLVHWGTVRSVIHSYRRKTSQRVSPCAPVTLHCNTRSLFVP